MTRKEFLKLFKLGIYGYAASRIDLLHAYPENVTEHGIKNWVWFRPWRNISSEEYKRKFEKLKLAGINSILPNVYASWKAVYNSRHLPVSEPLLEQLLPIAKSMDLEVHAWIWTMICNNEKIHEEHPDWFAVNRNGESTITDPAYVGYYRFMCPNNPQVRDFVSTTVSELSGYSELSGVHLDYVRFPDVILAKKLQTKYGIVQDKEYPQYDYCYCKNCRSEFIKDSGIDIAKLPDPDLNSAWRKFRHDSITDMVNNSLVPVAKKNRKMISAAVFPNWKNVRQEWSKWNLDAVLPMLYHDYYDEDFDWIINHIIKGKEAIDPSTKLYCGLMVDSFNPDELKSIIGKALKAKADGVSFFGYNSLSEDHWKILSTMNE